MKDYNDRQQKGAAGNSDKPDAELTAGTDGENHKLTCEPEPPPEDHPKPTTLKQFVDQRIAVSAIVGGFGQRSVHWYPFGIDTILLKDITHDGEILIGDVWMNRGKWAENLAIGNSISFEARVKHYIEGYQCHRDHFGGEPFTQEYGLERPTRVKTRA